MSALPSSERILLGPGPSLISPRVMRAMAAPVLSHLDPDLLVMMDEMRDQLVALFRAPADSLAFAVSGTGTSGMETAVANLVDPTRRVLVVVTGYFGDRLAQMCTRYGGQVRRLDGQWGRACDPETLRRALREHPADVVAMVHAETSTGVRNPIGDLSAVAHDAGALVIADLVTSLGGHPVEMATWGIDAAYSCTQKCIGAPSGLAPVAFAPSALARRVPSRSFYFDLGLLEDYWVRRKYHHTMSSTLIYALREALLAIAEEGLETRWARHDRHHQVFAAGIEAMGLSLLPPMPERLWTLNAVCVPEGVDEVAVRRDLLERFNIEIGAGLGPLAGRIWRIGLMGASSTPQAVLLLLSAMESVLKRGGYAVPEGAGVAAATSALNRALVTA